MATPTTVDTLLDIVELIERIERQTFGLGRERFITDHDVLDATAYRLLRQTDLSAVEIAMITGFSSGSAFSRGYREHFDRPPREDRREEGV